jgi:heme oxygenase (biliverdin-IX-beta and delta-forming)
MCRTEVSTRTPGHSLSGRLRASTAHLHARVDVLLGLPATVQDRQDYCRLLERFFGLYEPLERSFLRFDEWERLGLALSSRNHSSNLSHDLLALGIDLCRIPLASQAMMPELPTFPHALGALYVLEGSALGGRIILHELEARAAREIAGATRFLEGRGLETGRMWSTFRTTLDDFGCAWPHLREDVLSGAERVFRAILTWFTPFAHASVGAS